MNMSPAAYDLLVIGGGVNGAGIARDAAGRGLAVLLAERDDLAAAGYGKLGKFQDRFVGALTVQQFDGLSQQCRGRRVTATGPIEYATQQ